METSKVLYLPMKVPSRSVQMLRMFTLDQESATGGAWTISVRPASLRSTRKKYQSRRYKSTRIYATMLLGRESILESSLPRGVVADSSESNVRASYRVVEILAKSACPFTDNELVKECVLAITEEICPERKKISESLSLSARTYTRRTEDLRVQIMDERYQPFQPLPVQPTIEDYVRHRLQSSGHVCNCCYHTPSYPQE
ncbi:hypothetical protein EVAR_8849_1 [Eumeta japonica]|uniref:Uncharacterized protein n=1 Tax=Eumeta variegata TaxID=151549 RepID=A0A4C1TU11_EUMVA|nr:hypothetical protein EVAR_8849_1 [Eumeta japonica]